MNLTSKRRCRPLFVDCILRLIPGLMIACAALGCDERPEGAGAAGSGGAGGSGAGGTGGEADPFAGGAPLDVAVPQEGRILVDLDEVTVAGDGDGWELAFEAQDVFTNGGASGSGKGAAFGPFEAVELLAAEVPEHPFLIEDEPGGAFHDWYAYDGAAHALYSRYHVHGVRRGGAVFKVQILGYYGEVAGAPASALYSLRLARVTEAGAEQTVTLEGIDASAGGVSGTDSDPGACLVLETGEILALTPVEAAASADWDLCFRRSSVSVNGGLGGPGGVEAVDLDAGATAAETLEEVMKRTAESELARFDEVTFAALSGSGLAWHGDRIVSAFSDQWLVPGSSPLAPADFAWLVAGSDGVTPFLVAFESLSGATDNHPGTVRLRVKHIGGTL